MNDNETALVLHLIDDAICTLLTLGLPSIPEHVARPIAATLFPFEDRTKEIAGMVEGYLLALRAINSATVPA